MYIECLTIMKKPNDMATYYPYSQIILTAGNYIRESISRHAYFGEWCVCDNEQTAVPTECVAISEIYY